jgi:hypothetical protein
MFLHKKKKALSDVVAYVILISITISLSVIVYGWLRFYVGEEEISACSDGVNVIISSYRCYIIPDDVGGELNRIELDLKNKGRFTVDGFTLRVHNRTGAEFGLYVLNDTGEEILPGQTITFIGNLSSPAINFSSITFVEVQPFIKDKGKISCKSIATQKLTCP